MLTMTSEQVRALAEAQVAGFIDRTTKSLRAAYPAATGKLDDSDLRGYVSRTVAHLRSLGFEYTEDLARAVAMLFLLDDGASQPRMPGDLAQVFNAPSTSTEKKLEALEQVFLFGNLP